MYTREFEEPTQLRSVAVITLKYLSRSSRPKQYSDECRHLSNFGSSVRSLAVGVVTRLFFHHTWYILVTKTNANTKQEAHQQMR